MDYEMGMAEMDALEDAMWEHQLEEIKRLFGEDRAARANYGWGVHEGPDFLEIETKVYGLAPDVETVIFTTRGTFTRDGFEFKDSQEKY